MYIRLHCFPLGLRFFTFVWSLISLSMLMSAAHAAPRGAYQMPYTRYEAEAAATINGQLEAALDFDQSKTASEASNQRYISLPDNGNYVEWIMGSSGSGVTLRFTLPDSSDGQGRTGAVDILINGEFAQTVDLTSYYAWQYFPHSEPQNTPAARPRMRFDEVHFKLPRSLSPGDRLQIRKARQDGMAYGIDFVEVEPVPSPKSQPSGYVSITDFGAVPNDNGDDLPAMEAALEAAQDRGTGVYLPAGRFVFGNKLLLNVDGIGIKGAGMWHTELYFSNPEIFSGGILARSSNVEISDFYMGTINNRRFESPGRYMIYKAFMGTYGNNSKIHHVWAEHFEVGAWMGGYDAPYPVDVTRNITISHSRFRNNYADGINLSQGTSNSIVEHTNIRNNGDDGLAIWTSNNPSVPEGVENTFRFNTIEHGYRAGGVAIFGGRDHRAHNLLIKDCFAGSGMRFTTDFPGYTFSQSGLMRFNEITILNCGTSFDLWNQKRGAIEFNTPNGVRNMAFNDIDIINAQRHGVQLAGNNFQNITFNRVDIEGAGGDSVSRNFGADVYGGLGIMAQAGSGTVRFDQTYITGAEDQPVLNRNTGFNLQVNTISSPNNDNNEDIIGGGNPGNGSDTDDGAGDDTDSGSGTDGDDSSNDDTSDDDTSDDDTSGGDTGSGDDSGNNGDDGSADDDSDTWAGSCDAGTFGRIGQVPSVDGQVDAIWQRLSATPIQNRTVGNATSDFSAKWRALSTASDLYLLIEVNDAQLRSDSGENWWEDDAIEIFLDGDNSKGGQYDGRNDVQLGFRWNDNSLKIGGNSISNMSGVNYQFSRTNTGYNLEIKFPWSIIDVTPSRTKIVGFDIAVDDDDNGGARDAQYSAFATSDTAWRDPSVFGSVGFSDCTVSNDDEGNDPSDTGNDSIVGQDGVYRFAARHSGKLIDVSGISVRPGANVHQWARWGGNNQKWIAKSKGDGYWAFVSVHSDLCLEVASAGTANGANIQQNTCNDLPNQQFKLEEIQPDYYQIRARHSQRCIDVSGVSTRNGANIHQWDCLGQQNSQWAVEMLKAPVVDGNDPTQDGPIASGNIYRIDVKHSGKSLDVAGISKSPGANIHQWSYVGGENQKWKAESAGGGHWRFRSMHSGLCLQVANAAQNNGGNLEQNQCSNQQHQQFSLQEQDDGYYYIRARHSGRCVDVSFISPFNGANIYQWDCVGQNNAKWTFKLLETISDGDDGSDNGGADDPADPDNGNDGDDTTGSDDDGSGDQDTDDGSSGNDDGSTGGDDDSSNDSGSDDGDNDIDIPNNRGMDMPWIEHQAEDAQTNALVIGPSRKKWDANHIEAEAIGRKAVRLERNGDYVSFTTTEAANSIVVRFSIPDAPQGGGIDATLGLYVNGNRVEDLPLTSRYAWSYRGGLIGDPIVDIPAEQPHTFFDEVRLLLDDMPAGTEVKLQKDPQDTAAFYVIDLVDFEQVAPPLSMPEGFIPVTQFGAHPNDDVDDADAIARAMKSTSKLWFPPGVYLAEQIGNGNVGLDNPGIEVRGAGMWHTTIKGPKAIFFCIGANARCVFKDFTVLGESKARAEESDGVQKAFAGPMGRNSLIENIWVEHVVGGIWIGNDPPYQDAPTENLTIRNCRVRNTYADGVMLANGTSNSVVEHCHMRNTGDDAAVVWSVNWPDWVKEKTYAMGDDFIKPESKNAPNQGIGHGNTYRNITVQMPWRANCFANYGGYDNTWEDCVCEDVLTYPGILINNEFSPNPFGPDVTTFKNISLIRAGGTMFLEHTNNPWNHGALKFYLREGDVNDILVENVDIIEPMFSGIEFRGFGWDYVPPGERFDPDLLNDAEAAEFRNVTLRNIKVINAGTYGIEVIDNGGKGQVNFENVEVKGSKIAPLHTDGNTTDFFNKIGGNQGW